METKNIADLNEIANEYKKIISLFKKRSDVIKGDALGYRRNQNPDGFLADKDNPVTMPYGLATTGFCVSASQALLLDGAFQLFLHSRKALAKLVSIDIKEQFWGYCYSGTQNKWHTAILVNDSGINFIVDITCAQFGNKFVGKDIWDFSTWEKSLRSPDDSHVIEDFFGNVLTTYMTTKQNQTYISNSNNIVKNSKTIAKLKNNSLLDTSEREFLADFFNVQLEVLNRKLAIGSVNKLDFAIIEKVNNLLQKFNFTRSSETKYYVREFATKENALNWIKELDHNANILREYILLSRSVEDNMKYFGMDFDKFNSETYKNKTYICLEFSENAGVDISEFIDEISVVIPFGIKLEFTYDDIFNGGKYLMGTSTGLERKSNTIFIKCKN